MRMSGRLTAAFWERVSICQETGKCWEWTGYKLDNGYGKFTAGLAHRYAYVLQIGPIPDGLEVCHSCDNRGCVYPRHLYLATHQKNMRDMYDKGRHVYGERQGSSKATEETVEFIRTHYRRYDKVYGATPLAKMFGLSPAQIVRIAYGQHWRHVACRSQLEDSERFRPALSKSATGHT